MASPRLVLASTSASRHALLQRLGVVFEAAAPQVDETAFPGESVADLVRRLSRAKAEAVASRFPGALIIGSDQAAERDGVIVGKPGDHPRALAQLRAASGKTVTFYTGLCLLDTGRGLYHEYTDITQVRFRELHKPEIERYLQAEKPYGCAGSFKSEGLGVSLFRSIESNDPSALVGLPLMSLCRFLREAGLPVP
jgi:septum formation protein